MNKSYLLGVVLAISITDAAQAATISLSTGTESFNGLLLEGSGAPNVGVIFFHGRGQTPNGDVVRHLRQSLNTGRKRSVSANK